MHFCKTIYKCIKKIICCVWCTRKIWIKYLNFFLAYKFVCVSFVSETHRDSQCRKRWYNGCILCMHGSLLAQDRYLYGQCNLNKWNANISCSCIRNFLLHLKRGYLRPPFLKKIETVKFYKKTQELTCIYRQLLN